MYLQLPVLYEYVRTNAYSYVAEFIRDTNIEYVRVSINKHTWALYTVKNVYIVCRYVAVTPLCISLTPYNKKVNNRGG